MMDRKDERLDRGAIRPRDLLEFRPWMLALAVFLACAIGIAFMEQVRDGRDMWAQNAAQTQHP
jgi:hypothetical protein